jgi:uncharacterized protein YdeI (YjbR/CyaY-like superfamily)
MKRETPKQAPSAGAGRKDPIRFRTTILTAGKTTTGIRIPDEIIAQLGTSKKPAVKITMNGYTYRSTVAVMGGKFMVGVNAENREKAKVAGGDTVDVDIELDTAPREVTVPADFAAALNAYPKARKHFEGLSYSKQKAFVQVIEGTKVAETRQRRIEKAIADLKGAYSMQA